MKIKLRVCGGRITSKYGYRIHPITKVKTFHNGVDIACAEGTEVRTPVDSEAMAIYYHKTGGNTLILRDVVTNDRYSFAHLKGYNIKIGDWVDRGAVVAYSGNTGASTGAHLHFGKGIKCTWRGGNCIDFEFADPTNMIEFDMDIPRAMETR